MKNVLSLSLAVLLSTSAFAADCPTTLKETMKTMAPNFSALGKDAGDVTKYPSLVPAAKALRVAAAQAFQFVPKKITDDAGLTDEQKDLRHSEFQKAIGSLIDTTFLLEEGLRAGDSKKVTDAMKAIGDLKKSGHLEFK